MAAKKTTAKNAKTTDDPLALTYQLAELPTSQHRAGLVGMVMLVRYMNAQGTPTSEAAVTHMNAQGASFAFTDAGMTALFDCAYATTMGEVSTEKPYKNRRKEEVPPLRIETEEVTDKKGKSTTRTKYIYPKPIPKGAFLADRDPTGPDGVWIKLWRDMLWSIPRGVPATRRPFEARGEGETVSDGLDMYTLLKASPDRSVELASTYLLGAQANTADNVTFSDAAFRQLLLHFWPLATELYVPTTLTREGKTEFDGYVFAFPDVADLEAYCDEYFRFLLARGTDRLAYLPRSAVIDLPGEAGLRTMSWLATLLETRVQQAAALTLDDLVLAVDVLHARKDGNNVRILSHARVEPRRVMSGEYQRFAGSLLWSHVFRRQVLVNLLAERPWFTDFGRILATLPTAITFENEAFQHDARVTMEKKMTDGESGLPALLFRIATNYLGAKLDSKHDLSWRNEETRNDPGEYNKKKEKLAREALLAMRSRTGDDFVQYVTTTVFSVAQNMSKDNYIRVSDSLLNETETFRTLLMLAFSAQMPRPQKTEPTSE